MRKKEIIFVADDFGASPEVNAAVIRAHQEGALHGAALMLGQPATDQAIALARAHPTLQVGWHLHLTDSRPTTTGRWPWDEPGAGPAKPSRRCSPGWVAAARAGWAIGLFASARALAAAEIARQWDLFGRSGLPCAFFNSHHHLHCHPFVHRRVLAVLGGNDPQPPPGARPGGGPAFAGWWRLGEPRFFDPPAAGTRWGLRVGRWLNRRQARRCPFPVSDTLWGTDRLERMDAAEVFARLPGLPPGRHEFLFHPRHPDPARCRDTAALLTLRPWLDRSPA